MTHHRGKRRSSWRGKIPLALRRRASGLVLLGRGWRDRLVFCLLMITLLTGPSGLLANLSISYAQTQQATGKPNRFDPRKDATSPARPHGGGHSTPNWKAPPPAYLLHTVPRSMQPGTLTLQAGQAATFLGSDGRLEVDVPATAVTAADLAQAGGRLQLLISQIAPESGSNAGGSGHVSLGSYLVQLVDVHGKRATTGLHAFITLKLHYGTQEQALDLAHTVVVWNGALPHGVQLAPPAVANAPGLGKPSSQYATLDATQQTLTAVTPLSSPGTSVSWNTDSPVAVFGKPDLFNADLSAGSLSAIYPIDVPAGPGGLTPPINLAYSSAGVSEQHSAQGAAGWVGEGWNLSLGSISWAEHNTAAGCGNCTTDWVDSWQLNDPFGTSAELIPPDINVSTFLDDTGHGITASPIIWHTAPEAYLKVVSYTGPNSIWAASTNPPCFRVFLQNGIMEEFGCTSDSLQYYYSLSGTNKGYPYMANWLLDLITDPSGNQIHITYTPDSALDSVGGHDIRDLVPATIQWDSPGCLNAQQSCTGSNWAPLMQVTFSAAHNPLRLTQLLPGVCNTGSNLRCDDPLDLSGTGGLVAPQVQSTFVLNDIQVQVYNNSTWNTLRDYQLSYEQGGPTSITDPLTTKQESVAGSLDLTQIAEVGADGATVAPIRNFGYTTLTEHYEDDAYTLSSNCGPSWNTGCLLWSQSYGGNSRYLATISNGMGLQQTLTWTEGRNNTHGGYGGNALDPTSCDGNESQGRPCSWADDQAWSHALLTKEVDQEIRLSQNGQGGQQTSTPVVGTTYYTYQLAAFQAKACSDCNQGVYWGNQNDADYLDFYNGKFMGFVQATVTLPDNSVTVHKYYGSEGWGIYSTSLTCYTLPANPCHQDAWWDTTYVSLGLFNAAHGHEYEVDRYDVGNSPLLSKTLTQYQLQCPPVGVTHGSGGGIYNNNLVSELDYHANPVAACAVLPSQVDDYTYDGYSGSGSVPHKTTSYSYTNSSGQLDPYGRVQTVTVTINDGSASNPSPTTLVTKMSYIWNDSGTATSTSANLTYLIAFPAFTDTEDASGNRYRCAFTSYSGPSSIGAIPYETGQQSNFTRPLVSSVLHYSNCGTKANNFTDASGPITTTAAYDQWGNQWGIADPDFNAGDSTHARNCIINNGTNPSVTVQSTVCTSYDQTFRVLPTTSTNALGQSTSVSYAQSAAGGFGLWPTSATDLNSQTTSTTYDGLGRTTSSTLPGETSGLTTTSQTYTDFCSVAGPQSPCLEIDTTQRLNSTTTVTSRAFYDGFGQLVETRTPGPNGQDVVQYSYTDYTARKVFGSIQYFVTAYTGASGPAAYSIPDSQQFGTTATYTSLLSTTVTDALSESSTSISAVACNQTTPSGGTDSACYVQTSSIDPLGHKQSTLTDSQGREIYDQRYTGSSTPYTMYATTQYTYDYDGNLVQILHPGGTITTTFQYDMAGRQTGMTDPDRGTERYVYDANGNIKQTTDARGSAGTIYAGYNALNRQLWRNTTNNPTGAYVTYSYDSTANGNQGVGRLTGESFTNGSLTGSYSYVYDQRGRQVSKTEVVGNANYTTQATYDDAGTQLSLTYPDGEVVTTSYTTQEWLSGVTTQQGSSVVTLFSNATYSSTAGAGGMITGASLGGGTYQYVASYDYLLRLTDSKLTRISDGAKLFEQAITFNAAGNVTNLTTTLPQGTDQQQFCYDEQNRLTWAGSVGTPPCTGTAITPGSLTSAQYTQSFAYDTLDRLTSGPLGTYTYGDSHHVHAVTSIGNSYTASYDAAGDMTCRAPTSSSTCTGSSPTGAQLTYDNEGRLAQWQNAPNNPTTTVSYLYDGEGNRIAQQVTGSAPATTVYIGDVEEVTTAGSTTTTTTYYYGGKQRIALAINGVFSFLANDGLGSVSVALDANGNTQASQLFAPYGGVRYSSGIMPGSYGFTGQHADNVTGLDYYNARYYDPAAGRFTSADTVLVGLDRYAYVEDNPTTFTDPTGHMPGIGPWPNPGNWPDWLIKYLRSLSYRGKTVTRLDAVLNELVSGERTGGKFHYQSLIAAYRNLLKIIRRIEAGDIDATDADIKLVNELLDQETTVLTWANDLEVSNLPDAAGVKTDPFPSENAPIRGPIKQFKTPTSDTQPDTTEGNADPETQAFLKHLKDTNAVDSDSADLYGNQEPNVEHYEQVDDNVDSPSDATDPLGPTDPTTDYKPPNDGGCGEGCAGNAGGDPAVIPGGVDTEEGGADR